MNRTKNKNKRKEVKTEEEEAKELISAQAVNVELIINYLNYIAFALMFLFMLISHLCVWLIISTCD